MPIGVILICLLVVFAPFTGAEAVSSANGANGTANGSNGTANGSSYGANGNSTIEIRPRKAFLVVEDFQHWLGFNYQFSDAYSNTTSSANSTGHKFEEYYHFSLIGAIVNPRIFNFTLNSDVIVQQHILSDDINGTRDGHGLRLQYDLTATVKDRSWYPLTLRSSIYTNTVNEPFVPSQTYTTYNNNAELNILKNPYQAKLTYSRITLDISGGNLDNSTTTDTVGFTGSHNYRDISYTSLSGYWFNTNTSALNSNQSGDGYQIYFSNHLAFDRQQRYTLLSTFSLQDQTLAGVPQRNIVLTENFDAFLGKALEFKSVYNFANYDTQNFGGVDQNQTTNSINASLRHHLFSSLTTRLYGRASWSELLGGSEDIYAGGGVITYNKQLNPQTSLMLEIAGEHEQTNRKTQTGELTIRYDEKLVKFKGDFIFLATSIKSGSVTIYSYKPPTPPPAVNPIYMEGRDYIVDYVQGGVWISTTGQIPDNSTIYVTYTTSFSPVLDYSTDTKSANGTLTFLGGSYVLNGSYFAQTQTPDSLGSQAIGLRNTYIKQVSLQGKPTPEHFFNLQYYDYSAGDSVYHYYQGLWQYWHQFPLGNLSLQLRERYTVYDTVALRAGYDVNTLTASATYTQPLNYWSKIMLSFVAVDSRWGPQGTNDYLYFKLNYQARINRLTLSLYGATGWRFYGHVTLRDDYIRLEAVRYF